MHGTGVAFGTYYWLETDAPQGYDLPADPYSEFIEVNAGNAGEPQTLSFFVPRRPGALTVLKVDDADDAALLGATFDLVLDDGDDTYEPDEDAIAGTCTTGEDGTCSIGDLDFGTYFWVETDAPQGYELPDNPVSDPIVIDASNVDDERTPFEFRDPRALSERSVRKLAADSNEPLAGGIFELYMDSGADGVDDEPDDGDQLIGECATGEDGTCTIGELGFGDYYWFEIQAPDGYLLPDDRTSDVVTISSGNAGTVIAPVEFVDPPEPTEPTPTPTPEPEPEPEPTPTPQPPDLPDTGLGTALWAIALTGAALVILGAAQLATRRRVGGAD